MTIERIYLGEVDAKHELLKQKRSGTNEFYQSFSMPKQVRISDFIDGQKFFIHGLKGTGKTALLRYLHEEINRTGARSEVILFKSHVSEEDRQTLSRGAGFQIIGVDGVNSFTQDFKESWKWMIFQRIAEQLHKWQFQGSAVEKLLKLTNVNSNGSLSTLGALFGKISSGKLSLKGEAFGVAVELGVEGEAKEHEITVSPADLNRLCSKLLNEIDFESGFYLLFDELELVFQTRDQFDRDRRILRDLIYVISQFNADSAEADRKIFLISTLRTEVLHSILGLGHEIGKDVDDFGQKLDWSSVSDNKDHPLLNLVAKKISVSTGVAESDVWSRYFPIKINNQDYFKFILRSSYYRPRDIVRLLKVARDYNSFSETFTSAHFDATALEFSKQTWLEVTEELLASYSTENIQSMQRLFLGFNTHFFKSDLEDRILKKYGADRGVQNLFKEKSMQVVLEDLFRIGVIGNDFAVVDSRGNKVKRYGWIFRGNTILNDAERMTLHKSLWKHLSLVHQ